MRPSAIIVACIAVTAAFSAFALCVPPSGEGDRDFVVRLGCVLGSAELALYAVLRHSIDRGFHEPKR